MKSGLEDLMKAMAAAKGENRSDNIKFETEDACLAYCKRLFALKPGDEVLTKVEGEEARRGVFAGAVDEGKRALVHYMDEDNVIRGGAFPWGCIRFPE